MGYTYIMERARILCDSIQLSPKRTESSSIDTVAMRRSIDIWSCLMDSRMYHIRRRIEQTAGPAVNDFAFFVYEDQV